VRCPAPCPPAETGIPLQDTEAGLAVFILFFLFTAVNEGSGKFVDE
jgi:photosystem II protein